MHEDIRSDPKEGPGVRCPEHPGASAVRFLRRLTPPKQLDAPGEKAVTCCTIAIYSHIRLSARAPGKRAAQGVSVNLARPEDSARRLKASAALPSWRRFLYIRRPHGGRSSIGRALGCGPRGCGFKSRRPPQRLRNGLLGGRCRIHPSRDRHQPYGHIVEVSAQPFVCRQSRNQ